MTMVLVMILDSGDPIWKWPIYGTWMKQAEVASEQV